MGAMIQCRGFTVATPVVRMMARDEFERAWGLDPSPRNLPPSMQRIYSGPYSRRLVEQAIRVALIAAHVADTLRRNLP